MKREPTLWGEPDKEGPLHFDNKDDAINDLIDNFNEGEEPETITIAGYAPMKVVMPNILEMLLENLDEELSDPDGDLTEPTEAMKEAEKVFLAVIENEYKPWAHEEVCRKEINVKEWLAKIEPVK